jgi:hypothetical protein
MILLPVHLSTPVTGLDERQKLFYNVDRSEEHRVLGVVTTSKEVHMKVNGPPSKDIIFALVSLGFVAGEETSSFVALSDGNYTLKVPFEPASNKVVEELRDMLDEIFSYYALEVAELTEDVDSEDYDDNLKRVVSWAQGAGG